MECNRDAIATFEILGVGYFPLCQIHYTLMQFVKTFEIDNGRIMNVELSDENQFEKWQKEYDALPDEIKMQIKKEFIAHKQERCGETKPYYG